MSTSDVSSRDGTQLADVDSPRSSTTMTDASELNEMFKPSSSFSSVSFNNTGYVPSVPAEENEGGYGAEIPTRYKNISFNSASPSALVRYKKFKYE